MIYNNFSDLNNDSVFLSLNGFIPGSSLLVKFENFNLAGSIKFKAAVSMVNALEEADKLKPGSQIVESSSGNLGVALAMVSAERGYQFTCVTDPNVSPQNLALMKAYGANVIMVDSYNDGGFVKDRLRIINKLLNKNPKMVWTDQYSNPNNPKAHYQSTGPAILEHVPDVDYLFMGIGSSGTYMGCSQYIREYKTDVKVIAVDPVGSILFGHKAKARFIPGIGGSVKPALFDSKYADDVVLVKEADTLEMCKYMAKNKGLLIGGSTGTVLSAVKQYQHKIPKGSKVVVLAPDFGSNYLDTIYNDKWVSQIKIENCTETKRHLDNQKQEEVVE